MMAAIGGHRPGVITHVGLHTYADPRQEGCRINDRAKEQGREIVRLMQIDGRDYLFYKAFKIDACILHASLADEDGNISAENEPLKSDLLELASAVHNNGGTVIVEVNEVVKAGSLDPRHVLIHKSSVDYVVRADKQANIALGYFPQMIGDIRMPEGQGVPPMPLTKPMMVSLNTSISTADMAPRLASRFMGFWSVSSPMMTMAPTSHSSTCTVCTMPLSGRLR